MARTVDIALNPTIAGDVPSFNRIAPVMRVMKNVRYDDLNYVRKRPGQSEKWDTGVDVPVMLLIPENTGYAIDQSGNIFQLGTTVNNMFTISQVRVKPRYIKYDEKLIVATGTPLIEIDGEEVSLVGNGTPNAKYVVLINDYAIYLGHHPTQFVQAVQSNPKSVDTAFGARTYEIQRSGTIQNAIDYNENLLVFEERETEVWSYRGGDPAFVRQPGAKIDKGLGAVDSLVKADRRIWWFGEDGYFYMMKDFAIANISDFMKAEIDLSVDPSKWEGYDIRKESLVMWVNRASGQTLLFDYRREKWLDDNWWNVGAWQSLPFTSYMEQDNRQYFGSAKYDGLIHDWSKDYKTDNGDPIRTVREFTVPLSKQGFRAKVKRLVFRREANQANETVANPVFMVRTRFDKGTWSDYTHLTLGVAGDNNPYAQMDRIGYGREMDIEIVETDEVDFLITNIYATVERARN
jgi:hypothetical protein